MKYSAMICLLFLIACEPNRKEVMAELLSKQQFLKDSANNITERIGDCTSRGVYDSAEIQKNQLGAIHTRLIAIQFSIDSLGNLK